MLWFRLARTDAFDANAALPNLIIAFATANCRLVAKGKESRHAQHPYKVIGLNGRSQDKRQRHEFEFKSFIGSSCCQWLQLADEFDQREDKDFDKGSYLLVRCSPTLCGGHDPSESLCCDLCAC